MRLFYFENDSLNEIELHYGDSSWDSDRYGNFFDQTRRNIETNMGLGASLPGKKRGTETSWKPSLATSGRQDTTTLVLYYYTAENGSDSYRLLSLHYRGF